MKVKLTLALLATAISAAADTPRLIEALVRVESNGKANAIGDNGKAFGILQIHDQLVMEVAEEHAEEAAKIVQHLMQTTTQPPGITLKAPPEIATNLRDGH